MSQNKLFKPSFSLFVLKAHEKDTIQIDLFNESVDSLLSLEVSLLQRQTMINLLIESINEWNKFYYVIDLNQKWVCFNDMIRINLFNEQVN